MTVQQILNCKYVLNCGTGLSFYVPVVCVVHFACQSVSLYLLPCVPVLSAAPQRPSETLLKKTAFCFQLQSVSLYTSLKCVYCRLILNRCLVYRLQIKPYFFV